MRDQKADVESGVKGGAKASYATKWKTKFFIGQFRNLLFQRNYECVFSLYKYPE